MAPHRALVPTLALTLALAAFTAPATAQVFVVDASNGPGTDFTDLPTAVQAVPDGAALDVLPGIYRPFNLISKGLTIVARGGPVLLGGASAKTQILATSASQSVVLRGLQLPFGVSIQQAKGLVLLDSCTENTTGGPSYFSLDVASSDRVQLHDCQLGGTYPTSFLSVFVPTITATDSTLSVSSCTLLGGLLFGASSDAPAIALTRSRCLVFGGTIDGIDGQAGAISCTCCSGHDGTSGGTAIVAVQSTLFLLDAIVRGGAGGAPACCQYGGPCVCGGSGGDGVLATSSTLFVLGTQPVGGSATASRGCSPLPGQGIDLFGTANRVFVDPTAKPPRASITGVQQRGSTLTFHLDARPHTPAILLASSNTTLIPFEPIGIGSLLSQPTITVGPFFVPPTGDLALPWRIPTTFAPPPSKPFPTAPPSTSALAAIRRSR